LKPETSLKPNFKEENSQADKGMNMKELMAQRHLHQQDKSLYYNEKQYYKNMLQAYVGHRLRYL
jgi:hypothetical protein